MMILERNGSLTRLGQGEAVSPKAHRKRPPLLRLRVAWLRNARPRQRPDGQVKEPAAHRAHYPRRGRDEA